MKRVLVLALALIGCGAARPAVRELPRDGTLIDALACQGSSAAERRCGSINTSAVRFAPSQRYRGQVVVLDFWAGWCEECRKMVPQLARLAGAFAADGLVVVGVDAGEPPDDAVRYARELGMTYPIALDPELAFSDRVDAADLPVLLVIDRTGSIVHRSRHLDGETLGVIRRLVHP